MELNRGVKVGRYCIVAPLGHGGMGSVFRATDTNLGRDVAIKVVTDSLAANDEAMRRFDSEARLLASVNHPNIASIYGLEEHNGQKYIVLELVGGETLAERIARGPLPLHEALDIVRQITLGLEAAHAHGIIHRDIKPANIKITEDGTVKVLDFGLAKTLEVAANVSHDSDTALLKRTAAGVIVGTPMYMSPEQLRGEVLDARSDVWATGCVLFEALTGKQAFHASTYSGLAAAIIHEQPDWSELSNIPPYVRRLLERCLHKNREDRWTSARELRLGIFAASARGHSRRKTLLTAVASAVVLAIVIAIAVALRQKPKEAPSLNAHVPTQLTVAPGVENFPSWSADGKQLAYAADAGPVRKIFLKRIGSTNETQLTKGNFDDVQPSWSPDGRTIMFQRAQLPSVQQQPGDVFDRYESADIWQIEVQTGTEKKLLQDAFGPAVSPDGKRLAFDASFAGPRRIWVSDVTGRNPQQLTTDSTEAAVHIRPQWSPDGRKIAFQRIERTKFDVSVVDLESRQSTALTNDAPVDVNPTWSAAGDAVYFSSPRGGGMNVWRMPVDSSGRPAGQPGQVTFGAGQDVSIAVSPRSGQLAFVTLNQNADLWSLPVTPDGQRNGDPTALVDTTREESRAEWSPDGKKLAFNSDRGGNMNIWIMDLASRGVEQLTHGPGGDYQPAWSPDGAHVAFFSSRAGNLDVWAADVRGRKVRQLTKSAAMEINPFYSPDGSRIAYQSDAGGRLELWIMNADGSNPQQLSRAGVDGHFMRWTRDGSHILCRCTDGEARNSLLPVTGDDARPLPQVKGGAHLSLSADERNIADVVGHKTLWISPVGGGEARKLFEFDDPLIRIDYPVWSPEGTAIVFDRFKPAGGDLWLVDTRNGR